MLIDIHLRDFYVLLLSCNGASCVCTVSFPKKNNVTKINNIMDYLLSIMMWLQD